MKKILSASITLTFLAGCSLLETHPIKTTEAHSPKMVSSASDNILDCASPTWQVGQEWTFRRVDLWNNREIERFRQEFVMPDESRWIVRWKIINSDNQSRMGSDTREVFDPRYHSFADASISGSYEPLRFPLKEGKTWTFSYNIPAKKVNVKQTATVLGWEEVTVPAGQFKTLRINHEGTYTATEGIWTWSGRISETYWYSPTARRVVKREYRDTTGQGSLWDQWRDELVEIKR